MTVASFQFPRTNAPRLMSTFGTEHVGLGVFVCVLGLTSGFYIRSLPINEMLLDSSDFLYSLLCSARPVSSGITEHFCVNRPRRHAGKH